MVWKRRQFRSSSEEQTGLLLAQGYKVTREENHPPLEKAVGKTGVAGGGNKISVKQECEGTAQRRE